MVHFPNQSIWITISDTWSNRIFAISHGGKVFTKLLPFFYDLPLSLPLFLSLFLNLFYHLFIFLQCIFQMYLTQKTPSLRLYFFLQMNRLPISKFASFWIIKMQSENFMYDFYQLCTYVHTRREGKMLIRKSFD